jgi:hypothetical protein
MVAVRKSYAGAAVATTLNGAIAGGATTIVVGNGSSYPDGSAGPFVICLDRGLGTEEKVLISARTGNSMAVAASGRGFDGTVAVGHANAAPVEHVLDRETIDQANRLANLLTAKGDLFVRDATDVQRLAVGVNGSPLLADSVQTLGLKWGAAAAVLADGSVPFSALIAGPATDPVGANDLSRKAYVDAKVLAGDNAEAAARAAGDLGQVRRSAQATRAAGQTLTTGVVANISFDTETWDSDAYITVPSISFIIPAGLAGIYVISGSLFNSTGFATLMQVEGTSGMLFRAQQKDNQTGLFAGSIQCSAGSTIAYLPVGEAVVMKAYQNSGSNMNVTAVLNLTRVCL